jgi:hypothetical protein
MEAQPTLVWSERGVELHPDATVDPHLPCVVLPRDAKYDLTFRFAKPLDDLVFYELRMLGQDRSERLEHVADRLVKLGLAGISSYYVRVDGLELLIKHGAGPPGMVGCVSGD